MCVDCTNSSKWALIENWQDTRLLKWKGIFQRQKLKWASALPFPDERIPRRDADVSYWVLLNRAQFFGAGWVRYVDLCDCIIAELLLVRSIELMEYLFAPNPLKYIQYVSMWCKYYSLCRHSFIFPNLLICTVAAQMKCLTELNSFLIQLCRTADLQSWWGTLFVTRWNQWALNFCP